MISTPVFSRLRLDSLLTGDQYCTLQRNQKNLSLPPQILSPLAHSLTILSIVILLLLSPSQGLQNLHCLTKHHTNVTNLQPQTSHSQPSKNIQTYELTSRNIALQTNQRPPVIVLIATKQILQYNTLPITTQTKKPSQKTTYRTVHQRPSRPGAMLSDARPRRHERQPNTPQPNHHSFHRTPQRQNPDRSKQIKE